MEEGLEISAIVSRSIGATLEALEKEFDGANI
jgi:hypothetical protein